jgi:arginine-tRNA-protein transferase
MLSNPCLSGLETCPYLEGEQYRQQFFFADNVSPEELDSLLSVGWRKFGLFYFRPNCPNCNECISLRVNINDFKLSKSQKRTLNKNKDIRVVYGPLIYEEGHYELFVKHSKIRFSQKDEEIESKELFMETHYTESTESLLAQYFIDDRLIAVGYLDKGKECLSSVYFIYDPDQSKRSLGIFGALKEIEYAKEEKLKYYHLGYYIKENNFMNYKANFKPYEILDYKTGLWIKVLSNEK